MRNNWSAFFAWNCLFAETLAVEFTHLRKYEEATCELNLHSFFSALLLSGFESDVCFFFFFFALEGSKWRVGFSACTSWALLRRLTLLRPLLLGTRLRDSSLTGSIVWPISAHHNARRFLPLRLTRTATNPLYLSPSPSSYRILFPFRYATPFPVFTHETICPSHLFFFFFFNCSPTFSTNHHTWILKAFESKIPTFSEIGKLKVALNEPIVRLMGMKSHTSILK